MPDETTSGAATSATEKRTVKPPRRIISVTPPNGEDAVRDEIEGYDKIDLVKIEEVLEGLQETGGTVRINRKAPTEQVFQYITKIPINQFDIEHIKRTYGGGDYKCQTFRANGQLYKAFEFSIDYRFRGAMDDGEIKRLASGGAAAVSETDKMTAAMKSAMAGFMPAPGSSKAETDMMIKFMESSSQKSDQTMLLLITMMSKSSEQMMAMMSSMTTVMAAAMSNKGGTDITSIVTELLKNQKSDTVKMADMLELVRAAKDLHGNDNQDPLWERIARIAAPAVAPLAATIFGNKFAPNQFVPNMYPGQSAPAGSVTLPAPEVNPPGDGSDFVAWLPILRLQLLQGANNDADPAAYAVVVENMLEDDKLDLLRRVLTEEGWRLKLFGEDAAIEQHAAWFEELRQCLLNTDSVEETPDEPVANAGRPDSEIHAGRGQVSGRSDSPHTGTGEKPAVKAP